MRGCPRELAECDAMLHCQRLTEVGVIKLSTNSVTKRDIGHVLMRVAYWSRAYSHSWNYNYDTDGRQRQVFKASA